MSQTSRILSTALVLLGTMYTPIGYANVSHSYLSCAVITTEHLTALQLYQRGVALDDALNYLPRISRDGKTRLSYVYALVDQQGILNTYADINTNFARCAQQVFDKSGAPAIDRQDYGYYYCSGENKVRFELMINIDRFTQFDNVLAQTPSSHHDTAREYAQLIKREGMLAAFDLTANNLKACINNLNPAP